MTIRVTKEFRFEMAHALAGHDGPCRNIHGHSYLLSVTLTGTPVNDPASPKNGMVMDFSDLKKIVDSAIVRPFDHALVLLAAKILGTVIPIVLKLAGPIFTTLFNAIGKVIGIISGIVRAFIWMGNKAKDVGAKIGDVAGSIVRVISGLPGKIKSAASGMFDGIKDAFRGALNWIIDKWNGLSFGLPSVDTHIPGIGTVGGWSLSTPNIDRFANGGWIRGPGGPRSDRVPLLGSNGEFMVNAFAARKYGRVLERMNSGRPLPLAGSGGTVVNIDQITNVKPEQNLSVVDQIRQSLWLKGLTAP